MTLLKFHLLGNWSEGAVSTFWVESTHAMPEAIRAQVELAWRDASARPGVKLFDGPMCRLERWAADGETLLLSLSPTTYKIFMGTNLLNPDLADEYGPEILASPAGVSPALETADGFLMLGRRNSSVAYYPNRVHPFAGCLEPIEPGPYDPAPAKRSSRDQPLASSPGPDVFAAVRRELCEELGFTAADIAMICFMGIAEDVGLKQPELIFHARSTRTRARIESTVARDEHHDSWSVRATEAGVDQGLADPLLTPVAAASLLLWGRMAFGPDWFAERSRSFTTSAA